jgi:5-methyltetrahydropteroyltriglutamate--homocysteine methyltransferase
LSELKHLRTDVVGSLLRPAAWKEAKLRHEIGALDDAGLAEVELRCLREHVQLQESAGLDVVSDGELSRLNFQDSFGLSVSGYDAMADRFNANLQRAAGGTALSRWELPDLTLPGTPVVHRRPTASRLKLERNVPLEEYKRVAPLAAKPVKVALIGPDRIAQRFDHEGSKGVYKNPEDFLSDVVAIQRKMIQQLVDAGCRYVHIDAPGYTAYVDERSLKAMRARGEDPMENFARSLRADTELVRGFPGVTFGIPLCRGNQRSMWHRDGTYDAIAERLFGELPHDRFLLEYDSPRAGGFEPLRHVRKDAVVVLGLVSTKVAALESVDDLRRRVDAAAKHVPLDRLAISPQCGFASDVVGNLIEEEDQRRKLERVVEAARKIWS